MAPGDLLYSNTDGRNLCVAVQGSGDSWWNFATSAYETPTVFDMTKHTIPMTPSKLVPSVQRAIIPAKACADPMACLIESLAGGATLVPTNVYWIANQSVSIVSARGSTIRF